MTGPAARTSRIICVGCAFWDTIFGVDRIPSDGGKLLPDLVVQNASGMATVAATAIARLGGTVSLWTRIGDDPIGRLYLEDLAREGVDLAGVRAVPNGRTSFATILVDGRGERLVVAYPTPLDPDPGWLPLHEIDGAGAVMADMRWVLGARTAFARARAAGVPTILDADVAPLADLRALIPLADHVLFSEPALSSLTDGAEPETGLRRIAAELDAPVIGVTLGERGALVQERGGPVLAVPGLPVRAVDTLNAGDVWHGTYAYGLVQGWDLSRRARVANVAAAIKCERFGGKTGAPSLDVVSMRLAGEAAGLPGP